MHGHARQAVALLVALLLASAIPGSVVAYEGEVADLVTLGRTTAVSCTSDVRFEATIVDANGKPIQGQTVEWAIDSSPSAADALVRATSKTDADGVATNRIALACVAGQRIVSATADDAVATITINLTSAGLPPTDTAGDPGTGSGTGATLLALVWLGAVLLLVVAGRRQRRSR